MKFKILNRKWSKDGSFTGVAIVKGGESNHEEMKVKGGEYVIYGHGNPIALAKEIEAKSSKKLKKRFGSSAKQSSGAGVRYSGTNGNG